MGVRRHMTVSIDLEEGGSLHFEFDPDQSNGTVAVVLTTSDGRESSVDATRAELRDLWDSLEDP